MRKIRNIIIVAIATALIMLAVGCRVVDLTPEEIPPVFDRDPEIYFPIIPPENPLERFPETITMNVFGMDYPTAGSEVPSGFTPRNQAFNQLALEVLNINLNYISVATPAQFDTQLNMLINTGRMPDMFMTSDPVVFETVRNRGLIADLRPQFHNLNESLQRMYVEDFFDTLQTVMGVDPRGERYDPIWAFPTPANPYEFAKRIYIRRDWMDVVGWNEPPTTTEELIDLARAFRANDAAIATQTVTQGVAAHQIIPIAMHGDLNFIDNWGPTGLFELFGAQVGAYFLGENGRLYSSNTSPEMRNAVEALAQMRYEGLVDREFALRTSSVVMGHIIAGQIGIVFGDWWVPQHPLGASVTNSRTPGAEWIAIPMVGANGNTGMPIVKPIGISTYNIVSSRFAHPEALPRLLNLFYDIFYRDSAAEAPNPNVTGPERFHYPHGYGELATQAGGFFHNWTPVRLWNSSASIIEHRRIRRVFDELWEEGLRWDYSLIPDNAAKISQLNNCDNFGYIFNQLRTREKNLHFARGWHYFQARQLGVSMRNMSNRQRDGWGIYATMICSNGGYAYVATLTDGEAVAKYNEFFGTATPTMQLHGESTVTHLVTWFSQVMMGQRNIADWNNFVTEYNRIGGTRILEEVNNWFYAVQGGAER